MDFPLQLTFKILAVAPQVTVTDATGAVLYYVRQKAFKLKESVRVFADTEQTRQLASIDADRILDFSANYRIQSAAGEELGSIRRQGMRSFWRARYEVTRAGAPFLQIQEGNPWVKVIDGFLGEIPVIGLLSGYLFHPRYEAMDANDSVVLRIAKQPALFEGRYTIERMAPLSQSDDELAVLSIIMMVLLERTRG